jgi:hypothetical protein
VRWNTIPISGTFFPEVINVACSDTTRPVKGSGPLHVAIGAGGEKVNGGVPITEPSCQTRQMERVLAVINA